MKKLLSLLLSVMMIISCFSMLAACSSEKSKAITKISEDKISSTKDEALENVATESATEPVTETATVPAEEIPLVKNESLTSQYVYDYLTDNGPYTGNFYCTEESGYDFTDATNRLPQLNIDSEDAKEINEYLVERYSGFFARERYSEERVDYVVFQNGNILSLAVEQHYVNNNSYDICVFNIDVSTGKKLDSSEVVALSDATVQDVYDIITEDVETFYADTIANIPQLQEPQWTESLNETKTQTLDKENLEQAVWYFNGNGKLVVIYKMYWIAGAGINTEFLPTDVNFVG